MIYYNHKIHKASFKLPNKLYKTLKEYKSTKERDIKGVHYILDFEEIPFEIINSSDKLGELFETALKISTLTILEKKYINLNLKD